MPVTSSASTEIAESSAGDEVGRVFPCESCGADLEFAIGVQSLKCAYCGFEKKLDIDPDAAVCEQDYKETLDRLVKQRGFASVDAKDVKQVQCQSCGGTVRFVGTITSTECAYCGVPLQLDGVHEAVDGIPVDGVLPFLIDRKTAKKNLKEWVRSRWFAPNDFKSRGIQGRFNGVYLPYWTFDSLTFNRYTGKRGVHYRVTVGSGKNRRTVTRTRWYPTSGAFQRFFDDVLIIAGRGLPDKRLMALEPWPLNMCAPFNPQMLSGFLARTYDVALEKGFEGAGARMEEAIRAEIRMRIGGDVQIIDSLDTRHDAVTYKHLLLPVWMLAYRYGKKSYQVVVNAGTGEVQGDRPWSWVKIMLAVFAGASAIGLILSLRQ
jgi:predicted RNA-binding Zn-ribbon protein involved in translation (DUF1610 family)